MNSDLPKSWDTAPLSDLLISLESGSRPRGGVRGISDGVPSIGGEHLKYDGSFDFTSVKYVPKEFAEKMNKGQIKVNDVLIVKDGATTGKTAFVDSNFPYRNAVVNEHVFICRPNSKIDARYLYRFLMSKNGQDSLLENFKGSAQGGINQSFAPNTEIPIAPYREQLRISAKLDKLIERMGQSQKRLIKIPIILKRFRQSILAAACSGRLTADWRKESKTNATSKEFLQKVKKERLRLWEASIEKRKYREPISANNSSIIEIPDEWTWATVDQLSTKVVDGIHHKPKYISSGIPFLSVRNLTAGTYISFENTKFISLEDHKEFYKRANPEKGEVAQSRKAFRGSPERQQK